MDILAVNRSPRKVFTPPPNQVMSNTKLDLFNEIPSTLVELYSGDDLEGLFPGGFINFGYYDGINIDSMTEKDRIQSQRNLYKHVTDKLNITPNDSILEIGIGHGGGPAWTAENFALKKITAIDIFANHVELAKKNFKAQVEKYPLFYEQAVAENLPFSNGSQDGIYTIEAFQHFTNQQKFIEEAGRVLKSSRNIVISTFLLTDDKLYEDGCKLIPKIAIGPSDLDRHDHIITARQLSDELEKNGFIDIKIESIGEHVWTGYNKWVAATENNWDLGWFKSYKSGILDYYIVTGTKK